MAAEATSFFNTERTEKTLSSQRDGVIGLEGGYSPSFKHGVWMVQPPKVEI